MAINQPKFYRMYQKNLLTDYFLLTLRAPARMFECMQLTRVFSAIVTRVGAYFSNLINTPFLLSEFFPSFQHSTRIYKYQRKCPLSTILTMFALRLFRVSSTGYVNKWPTRCPRLNRMLKISRFNEKAYGASGMDSTMNGPSLYVKTYGFSEN